MKLAIVGSRDYSDYSFFSVQIEQFLAGRRPDLIISGGASGIDSLAERYAREHDLPLQVFAADWRRFGKSAGPRRNTQIVDAATHLLAFPSATSVGTYDSVRIAQMAVLPTVIIHV